MSYTSITNVAGMFPNFARGGTNQRPADTLIQQYVDDVAGEVDAVLNRRFATAIGQFLGFSAWLASLPAASASWQGSTAYVLNALALDSNGNPQQVITAGTSGASQPTWSTVTGATTNDNSVVWKNVASDASRILEKINRYGASAQLAETLATFGVAAARELGKAFRDAYLEMLNELDARDANGKPLPSGRYDKQFDSLARTETPRPPLQGVAGGDMPAGETPAQQGLSNVFGKFDKRGT
jgi:hypothetical protein